MKNQQDSMGARDSTAQGELSITPSVDVLFQRELHHLLKANLEGPQDTSVALSARPMSKVFGGAIPTGTIPLEEARGVSHISVDGYKAWPIFVTPGYRNTLAAVVNRQELEKEFPDYFPAGISEIRGSIGEAVRNVGQHGHGDTRANDALLFDQARFASAGLFVKEISFSTTSTSSHRVLMVVVADEGRGLPNPEWSMLDGVGVGDDHEGMGVELRGALVYLVKASKGEWSLFDGLRASVPTKYVSANSSHQREIGDDERVSRVSSVDLPAPARGCQKIALYAHPTTSREDAQEIQARLFAALKSVK